VPMWFDSPEYYARPQTVGAPKIAGTMKGPAPATVDNNPKAVASLRPD